MSKSNIVFVTEMAHLNKFEIVIEGVSHVVSMCNDVVDFVLSNGLSFNCFAVTDKGYKIVNGEVCETYRMSFYRVK